jgi:polyhydroxybutyrate depolymerase
MRARTLAALAAVGISVVPAACTRSRAEAKGDPALAAAHLNALASRSSGCGVARVAGVSEGTLLADHLARTYTTVLPTGYDPEHAYPLVLGFHGNDQGSRLLRKALDLEARAEAAGGAVFVYPDAVVRHVWRDHYATHWGGEADFPFVDALLERTLASACIDARKVFVVGYSSGGYFANDLACTRSDVVAAAAAIEGGGPQVHCTGSIPMLLVHDERDPQVLFVEGKKSLQLWLAMSGCRDETVPRGVCVAHAECLPGREVVWCTTNTGNHAILPEARDAVWTFLGSRF